MRFIEEDAQRNWRLVQERLDELESIVNSIPRNAIAAGVPSVTDDESQGFSIFSKYQDSGTNLIYICKDATSGAAVWALVA